MFVEGTSLKKKALAWTFLAMPFGLIGLIFYCDAMHNRLLEVVAAVPVLLGLVGLKIYGVRRGAYDPIYAQKLAEAREHARPRQISKFQGLLTVLIAVTGFLSLNTLRSHHWNIYALPLPTQMFILFLGLCAVFVLIEIGRGLIRRSSRRLDGSSR